jgi:solute carrier family 8 (sodium/calcium exchanger)
MFSLIAYIWLYLVLEIISPNVVEIWEAWVTLAFFFVLCILAYIADKCNESKMKIKTDAELKKVAEEYAKGKKEHE